MPKSIRIGTRGSKLALWQANYTKDLLKDAGYDAELIIIKTKGDQIQHLSFDKIEGKGFFTKEIEQALIDEEIDVAVHSCKDLPTALPPNLKIAAYSKRANPADILLVRRASMDKLQPFDLKTAAVVGTSSSRRKAQLLSFRPDVVLKDIRGNVPTRIQKLRNGDFDAIVLAAAGIERLALDIVDLHSVELKPWQFIAAPAQGVLAYEIRKGDEEMERILRATVHSKEDAEIVGIERSLLNAFDGGCHIPLGIYAKKDREDASKIDLWISKAENTDDIIRRLHLNLPSKEKIDLDRIVSYFSTKLVPRHVFISRSEPFEDYLSTHLNKLNYSINYQSFISFNAVDFEANLTEYNWLFFTSKKGVDFFFNSVKKLPDSLKIAAINIGTASYLATTYKYAVDFVGGGASITDIANQFGAIHPGKVLFPQAKKSRRSIQKQLGNQIEATDLIVYDNQPLDHFERREEEMLIFTSPMNAQTYFSKYSLTAHQKVVSIGQSTSKALQLLQIDHKTAYEPTLWAILDEVLAFDIK